MQSKLYYSAKAFFLSFKLLSARTIGRIFDADYANKAFGEVKSYVEIDNNKLKNLLEKAGEYIMFNIDNGSLRALSCNRKSVLGEANSKEEVFYKMSTSQVLKLLEKGEENITRIEMRPKTLTLTNGDFTLELVLPCPPYCP